MARQSYVFPQVQTARALLNTRLLWAIPRDNEPDPRTGREIPKLRHGCDQVCKRLFAGEAADSENGALSITLARFKASSRGLSVILRNSIYPILRDSVVDHGNARWRHSDVAELLRERLTHGDDLSRQAQGPSIQLVVNQGPSRISRIAMMKGNPRAASPNSREAHQKMRLHVVGFNDVRPNLFHQIAQCGEDP